MGGLPAILHRSPPMLPAQDAGGHEWAAWWKRAAHIPFSRLPHPEECPGTTDSGRLELWKRSLGGGEPARALQTGINSEVPESLGLVMGMGCGTLLGFVGSFLSGFQGELLAISGGLAGAAIPAVRTYMLSARLQTRSAELSGPGCLQRLAGYLWTARRKGVQLPAGLEEVENLSAFQGSEPLLEVPAADILALVALAEEVGRACESAERGSRLILRGEDSELLSRVAEQLGYEPESEPDYLLDDFDFDKRPSRGRYRAKGFPWGSRNMFRRLPKPERWKLQWTRYPADYFNDFEDDE